MYEHWRKPKPPRDINYHLEIDERPIKDPLWGKFCVMVTMSNLYHPHIITAKGFKASGYLIWYAFTAGAKAGA